MLLMGIGMVGYNYTGPPDCVLYSRKQHTHTSQLKNYT